SAYGPADALWSYTASGFYSNHLGGNQRLPNGNTLIAKSTSGYLFEVNQAGNTVWSYNRGGEIARTQRYPYSYSGVSALPVELTSFNANLVDGKIELSWITNSEINNNGFEIYRSQDAIQFDKIGFISGRGTDTDINSYSFLDAPISNGKYYYKLKQIDFDGNFEYSNLVEVEFYNEMDFALLQNYPNPFNPNTTIEFILPVAEIVVLKIYNLLGSEVETLLSEYREAGRHSITFNASNLSSGVYLYRLSSGKSVQSKQMILVK
ncbi:MAG: T9SS type A sorting domain-containing protein, partial [Ignavibacteriaceae bacterium]|nr:T9SS type A sorting domain-containing protein [Ignavibacteriaceae bacterium]